MIGMRSSNPLTSACGLPETSHSFIRPNATMPSQMELPAQWHQRYNATLGFELSASDRDGRCAKRFPLHCLFGTHL